MIPQNPKTPKPQTDDIIIILKAKNIIRILKTYIIIYIIVQRFYK